LPSVCCLRAVQSAVPEHPAPMMVGERIDRNQVQNFMSDLRVTSATSLAAALTHDALRHLPRALHLRFVSRASCRWSEVVHHLSIPNLRGYVQRLPYFSALLSHTEALEYLFGKVLNRKCQTRKFNAVTIKRTRFDEKQSLRIRLKGLTVKDEAVIKKQKELVATLRQLVLCTLLGNYPHSSASSRPKADVRIRLYHLFVEDQSEHNYNWFIDLIDDCSPLIEYALRDYLVYTLPDNPGLFKYVGPLMQFDKWSGIVNDATARMRRFFSDNLCLPVSGLYRSFNEDHAWVDALTYKLASCKSAMLAISYRVVNASMGQMLRVARRQVPLVRMEGQEQCDLDLDPPSVELDALGEIETEDTTTAQERTHVLSLTPYISMTQYQYLRDQVLHIGPNRPGVVQLVIASFVSCGVPLDVVQKLLRFCATWQRPMSFSADLFRTHCKLLATNYPHAYNLLQVVVEIQYELQRLRLLRDLPKHYIQNQMEAIREHHGWPRGYLPEKVLYFVYCVVCDKVYSLISDAYSVYKADYEFGLRDAAVDLDTGKIYCKRGKVNQRGKCGELSRTFILGKLLRFNNKLLMICPQKGCGGIMALDIHTAMHNDYGYACDKCTKAARKVVLEPIDLTQTCLFCPLKVMKSANAFHYYPRDLRICRRHHSDIKGLLDMVNERLALEPEMSTEELIQAMVAHRNAVRELNKERSAPYEKRLLSISKMASRR
jgi:hypothetical protein